MAKTAAQMRDMYQDAIEMIAAYPNQSQTVLGKTFNRHNLTELEALYDKWASRAARSSSGTRFVMDLSEG